MNKKAAPFLAGIAFGLVLNSAVAVGAIPAPLRGWLGNARADVATVEVLASKVADPHLRRGLLDASARLHHSLDGITAVVDQPPPPRLPPIASEGEVAAVLGAMDRATFSDAQVAVVRDVLAGGNRRFTTDQVVRIMDEVSFPSAQVEIGTMLYPFVADPGRWFLVLDSLTFQSSREQLRRQTTGV